MTHETLLWLWDISFSISLLIGAILLVRRPVAQYLGPKAAYLLWLAPLMRLALPDLAIIPAPDVITSAPFASADSAAPSVAAMPVRVDAVADTTNALPWLNLALVCWIVGAFGFIIHIVAGQVIFRQRILRHSISPSTDLTAEAHVIAHRQGLSRRFTLRVAKDNSGPLVTGFFNPLIIVPDRFERDFTPVERQLALAHEMLHIKRGDLGVVLVALMFRACFWPNPLVHYAFRAFRSDQEAACDAAVLTRATTEKAGSNTHAYASAILKSISGASTVPAASLSIAHPLKERLQLMKTAPKKSTRSAMLLSSALIVTGLAATATYSYAAPKEQEVRVQKQVTSKKSERKSVITVDGDERLIIEGLDNKNAKKVVFEEKNGKRRFRVYDGNGRKLVDKRYSASDDSPFGEIIIEKDGQQSKVIDLATPENENVFVIMAPDAPHPPAAPNVNCMTSGDGAEHNVQVFSWVSDDGDDGDRIITQEVVCLDGVNKSASPEQKADALRKAIETLEREGKRAEERRKATISRLKEQLKEVEKKK